MPDLMIEKRRDYDELAPGDRIRIHAVTVALKQGRAPAVENATNGHLVRVRHELSRRQVDVVLAGGLFNWMQRKFGRASTSRAPRHT